MEIIESYEYCDVDCIGSYEDVYEVEHLMADIFNEFFQQNQLLFQAS